LDCSLKPGGHPPYLRSSGLDWTVSRIPTNEHSFSARRTHAWIRKHTSRLYQGCENTASDAQPAALATQTRTLHFAASVVRPGSLSIESIVADGEMVCMYAHALSAPRYLH
jgi:hypothetical protein